MKTKLTTYQRVKQAAQDSWNENKDEDYDFDHDGSYYKAGFIDGATWMIGYIKHRERLLKPVQLENRITWKDNPCPNKNSKGHSGCKLCSIYAKALT